MADLQISKFDNYYLIKTMVEFSDPSILPRVADYIFKINDERIIDINATNAEVSIHSNILNEKQVLLLVKSAIKKIESEAHIFTKSIDIPVCYELGNDWQEVEDQIGLSKKDYVEMLSKLSFNLVMFGFIPGFSYLSGLPKAMHCKRKEQPSKKIEANTLALGGSYIGIYGLESPGGWLDIGRIAYNLINLPKEPPHILDFQTKVNFLPISVNDYNQILQKNE